MKVCFKCDEEKPLADFYRHPAMSDGHLNKCKTCTKLDVRKHREENIEKIRQYDKERASLPHRIENRRRIVSEWASKFPERKKAQEKVNNAIRDGRLTKHPCFICGGKAVAHHPDYSRPLDVVWLCQAHHKQAHALVHERIAA